MAEKSYDIDSVSFARPIKQLNGEWVSHAFVELENGERRGVFLNVGPLIVRKGTSPYVHMQIEEGERFRQSWPALALKAAKHISDGNKKLSFNRLSSAIENPFKETGLVAKLASKLSLKDNRGAVLHSMFPGNSTEENGWALLQFEGLTLDSATIVPRFILHGMLLIREDAPDEFDVMNLTDIGPAFPDLESHLPVHQSRVPEVQVVHAEEDVEIVDEKPPQKADLVEEAF